MKSKRSKIRSVSAMTWFDGIFDRYNKNEISKKDMLKLCKALHSKLFKLQPKTEQKERIQK